jgi:hypothetical protein
MKPLALRLAYVAGFIAASCIGGFYLGAGVSRTPFWIPEWLFHSIHVAAQSSGLDKIDNEDDIEVLCDAALWITCSVVVALVLILITRHVPAGPGAKPYVSAARLPPLFASPVK